MDESKPVVCSNCHQLMDPVELHDVSAEDLKDFLSVDGNKLEENWYWCSGCDSFEQRPIPTAKLSPEFLLKEQELKSYLSDWWL